MNIITRFYLPSPEVSCAVDINVGPFTTQLHIITEFPRKSNKVGLEPVNNHLKQCLASWLRLFQGGENFNCGLLGYDTK
jgi:hypothetical protein